jgi:hypothetical protein
MALSGASQAPGGENPPLGKRLAQLTTFVSAMHDAKSPVLAWSQLNCVESVL